LERGVLYCVVPRELRAQVHDLLREHWREDPSVIVLRERRRAERRTDDEAGGRRVADRRLTAIVAPPARLPHRLRAYAARLTFAQHRRAGGRDPEDVDSDRLVVLAQRGDTSAFDALYARYVDRVFAYARVSLQNDHDAEDATQQVFGNVVKALPRYQVREDSSFRAWLFRITRNVVLRMRETNGRSCPQEPAELERRVESLTPTPALDGEWLSDKDLAMLVGRLPLSQQQVILLRYVFDFTTREIADAMDRTVMAVRMLEHRATRGLETRLHALRGTTRRTDRAAFVSRTRPAPVLFHRRFALLACGAAPL
jgi:RNA polymerase sigma-70 factor (ECF subfamily)